MRAIDKIDELRIQMGLKDSQLCKGAGITNGLLNHWRDGRQKPSANNLAKIAAFFGITLDHLIEHEERTGKDALTAKESIEIEKTTHEVKNQSNEGDVVIPGNETLPIDLEAMASKGYIVIERKKGPEETRIFLPPTDKSFDLARELAMETSAKITVEAPPSPSPASESRKDRDEARGKILCLHPGCGGELRRVQREDGAVIWECLNCGRTYEEKAA